MVAGARSPWKNGVEGIDWHWQNYSLLLHFPTAEGMQHSAGQQRTRPVRLRQFGRSVSVSNFQIQDDEVEEYGQPPSPIPLPNRNIKKRGRPEKRSRRTRSSCPISVRTRSSSGTPKKRAKSCCGCGHTETGHVKVRSKSSGCLPVKHMKVKPKSKSNDHRSSSFTRIPVLELPTGRKKTKIFIPPSPTPSIRFEESPRWNHNFHISPATINNSPVSFRKMIRRRLDFGQSPEMLDEDFVELEEPDTVLEEEEPIMKPKDKDLELIKKFNCSSLVVQLDTIDVVLAQWKRKMDVHNCKSVRANLNSLIPTEAAEANQKRQTLLSKPAKRVASLEAKKRIAKESAGLSSGMLEEEGNVSPSVRLSRVSRSYIPKCQRVPSKKMEALKKTTSNDEDILVIDLEAEDLDERITPLKSTTSDQKALFTPHVPKSAKSSAMSIEKPSTSSGCLKAEEKSSTNVSFSGLRLNRLYRVSPRVTISPPEAKVEKKKLDSASKNIILIDLAEEEEATNAKPKISASPIEVSPPHDETEKRLAEPVELPTSDDTDTPRSCLTPPQSKKIKLSIQSEKMEDAGSSSSVVPKPIPSALKGTQRDNKLHQSSVSIVLERLTPKQIKLLTQRSVPSPADSGIGDEESPPQPKARGRRNTKRLPPAPPTPRGANNKTKKSTPAKGHRKIPATRSATIPSPDVDIHPTTEEVLQAEIGRLRLNIRDMGNIQCKMAKELKSMKETLEHCQQNCRQHCQERIRTLEAELEEKDEAELIQNAEDIQDILEDFPTDGIEGMSESEMEKIDLVAVFGGKRTFSPFE